MSQLETEEEASEDMQGVLRGDSETEEEHHREIDHHQSLLSLYSALNPFFSCHLHGLHMTSSSSALHRLQPRHELNREFVWRTRPPSHPNCYLIFQDEERDFKVNWRRVGIAVFSVHVWNRIGHLQSNKAKSLLGILCSLQSFFIFFCSMA